MLEECPLVARHDGYWVKVTLSEVASFSMTRSSRKGPSYTCLVRRDGDRFVLVHGLHRLEACKALGEETIYGYLVQAQKH
jgi:hypothetical protein